MIFLVQPKHLPGSQKFPVMDQLAGADVFNLFHTIGSAGGLYALLAPYFVAFSHFSQDRRLTAAVTARFGRCRYSCGAFYRHLLRN